MSTTLTEPAPAPAAVRPDEAPVIIPMPAQPSSASEDDLGLDRAFLMSMSR
jgi:hypothetical protein